MKQQCALIVVLCLLRFDAVASDWVLTWSDEFNEAAGSAPDDTKWGYDIGNGDNGWGNEEKEYYTDSRENSAMDGEGNLLITATKDGASQYTCYYGPCEYTSARLVTENKFTQTYGRFEARMQLPYGQGTWPAFWLLGANFWEVGWPACGEIDIMEMKGSQTNTILGSIHGPGYTGSDGIFTDYTLPSGTFSDDFHIFIVEWSANNITFSVDQTAYFTQTPADLGDLPWVFDHPFFIITNFAVGGVMDGDPPEDGTVPFPQSMVIDYIRVYNWE